MMDPPLSLKDMMDESLPFALRVGDYALNNNDEKTTSKALSIIHQ